MYKCHYFIYSILEIYLSPHLQFLKIVTSALTSYDIFRCLLHCGTVLYITTRFNIHAIIFKMTLYCNFSSVI